MNPEEVLKYVDSLRPADSLLSQEEFRNYMMHYMLKYIHARESEKYRSCNGKSTKLQLVKPT